MSPWAASSAAVPIQMGFVRFGGILVSDLFPDSGYRDTMPSGML